MNKDALPNPEQRRALGELMHQAFIDLRHLDGAQAHDLAYAFHNLPVEIDGWGTWSVDGMRARLEHYVSKHPGNQGFDYLAAFDAIFKSST